MIKKSLLKKYCIEDYIPSRIENLDMANFKDNSNYLSSNWRRYFHILDIFLRNKPKTLESIVNIGSYPGTFERLIREYLNLSIKKISAVGLNFSDEYLKIMNSLSVDTLEVDIDKPILKYEKFPYKHDIPLEDNSIDYVTSFEIFEHLVNPLHMIEEAYRILEKDGVYFLTTPNLNDIACIYNLISLGTTNQPLLKSHVYENDLKHRRHIHLYNSKELQYILKDKGFKNIKTYFINCEPDFRRYSIPKKLKSIVRKLLYVMPPYRTHIYIVGTK